MAWITDACLLPPMSPECAGGVTSTLLPELEVEPDIGSEVLPARSTRRRVRPLTARSGSLGCWLLDTKLVSSSSSAFAPPVRHDEEGDVLRIMGLGVVQWTFTPAVASDGEGVPQHGKPRGGAAAPWGHIEYKLVEAACMAESLGWRGSLGSAAIGTVYRGAATIVMRGEPTCTVAAWMARRLDLEFVHHWRLPIASIQAVEFGEPITLRRVPLGLR